jgi:thiamine biosynthesis lipoprotein
VKISTRLIIILITIAIFATFPGCAASEPKRYSRSFLGAFDTAITLIGYSNSQKTFDKYADQAQERFLELHQIFDRYNAYEGVNNIYTINHEGYNQPVKVAPELISMLEHAIKWQEAYPGAVNIALGSVLEIWHDVRAEALADPVNAELPDRQTLEEANLHTSIDNLVIDETTNTVMLTDPELKIDLGAVAKGYATELVTQELIASGWDSFIISSGGNVRTTSGPSAGGRDTWNIGIQDPEAALSGDEDKLLMTLMLTNQSVVTSGDYQRYYIYGGRRYHHIVDPQTLEPSQEHTSVTVVTEDSGLADFLSTTLFILPYEQGLDYIEKIDGAEAVWVLNDGTVKMTAGLHLLIQDTTAQNES